MLPLSWRARHNILFLILCGFIAPDSRCFAILKHSYLRRFAMHAIKWIVVTMSFLSIRDRRMLDPVPRLKKKHSK
jgi:hypothetical protein